jgi:hypothetical protein
MRALAITTLFVLLVAVVALGVWIVREGFVDTPADAAGSGAATSVCATGCKTASGSCLTTLVSDTQGNMLPAVACESDPNVTEDECNSCEHCQWCASMGKCVSKKLFTLLCPASAAPAPAPANRVPILGPGGAQMDPTSAEPSASAAGLLGPGGEARLPATDAAAQVAPEANAKGNAAALLRDIQQIVHNELLQNKGMTTANAQPLFQAASKERVLLSEDPSLQQGAEHCNSRPTYCPKDMSQYIRKDQIPCWGCTLDY